MLKNNKMKVFICKNCYKEFTKCDQSRDYQFCSRKCSGQFYGHLRKGIPRTLEVRNKVSETLKKTWVLTPGREQARKNQKNIITKNCKGCNEEFQVPYYFRRKKYCSKQCLKEHRIHWNKGLTKETDERVRLNQEHRLQTISDPVKREEIANITRNVWKREGYKERLKQSISITHNDPIFKKDMSVKIKNNWETEYTGDKKFKRLSKWIAAGAKHPNYFENEVMKLCPSVVKFTGDRSFWLKFISGKAKNPDAIIEFEKKAFEFNGKHWHSLDENIEKDYEQIGWKCLVIWQDELKDKDTLKDKILNYIRS